MLQFSRPLQLDSITPAGGTGLQRWQERYRDQLVSADEALQVIQPHQTVTIGMNGTIPAACSMPVNGSAPSC
jgi:hypothetical protein